MDGGVLIGSHGNGESPSLAIRDYVCQIAGKRIAIDAFSKESRREFVVPKELMP